MEIREQYGRPDLKQFMTGSNHLPVIQQDANPLENLQSSQMQYPGLFPSGLHPICGYRNPNSGQHYGSMSGDGGGGQCGMVFPPQRLDLRSPDSSLTKCGLTVAVANKNQSEFGVGGGGFEEFEEGGDGGSGRWPRQETLTLLEIRSKMDSKFRETNQKGPLWDEVSRVLAEEHGYQRSGKKCREKFENLYKYYKKTKESKAGRQDGKHYRFFNQLEALYGGTNNPSQEAHANKNPHRLGLNKHSGMAGTAAHNLQAQKLCESPSMSGSSESEASSSSNDARHKKGRKSWKSKIKMFVDLQMKKLIEKQDEWLEKVLQTLEHKEQERISREEAWRTQEAARFDRQHKLWANERAWVETRDVAIMEALQKLTEQHQNQPQKILSPADSAAELDQQDNNGETHNSNTNKRWPENEILSLIKLRTAMETRFQEASSKGNMWEEISTQMGQLGYDRSAKRCKEKWENINKYFRKTKDSTKKRKENSRTCPYFQHLDSLYSTHQENGEQAPEIAGLQPSQESSPSNSNAKVHEQENCFRILMSEETGVENMWENYGFKINKEEN